jgi:hypothetical protein
VTVTNPQHIAEWLKRHWNADNIVLRNDGTPYYAHYDATTYMYDPDEVITPRILQKLEIEESDNVPCDEDFTWKKWNESKQGHEPKGSMGS